MIIDLTADEARAVLTALERRPDSPYVINLRHRLAAIMLAATREDAQNRQVTR